MSTVAIEQPVRSPRIAAAEPLLEWYDKERRDLPWRYGPDETPDPYRVWLSEIMLQQTTVKAVIPYFQRFLARWPDVRALAAAPLDDVLAAWAGLGYYSRARNLHACARAVTEEHCGNFPSSEAELKQLPGIGPYTAAAIAAIAFGAKSTPVDGNIERVVARLFAVEEPMPGVKPRLRELAARLTPEERAGDFAQGLMDLGARICTPKRPSCLMCPLKTMCVAGAAGIAATLPASPRQDQIAPYATASHSWPCVKMASFSCAAVLKPVSWAACWRFHPRTGEMAGSRPKRRFARRRSGANGGRCSGRCHTPSPTSGSSSWSTALSSRSIGSWICGLIQTAAGGLRDAISPTLRCQASCARSSPTHSMRVDGLAIPQIAGH